MGALDDKTIDVKCPGCGRTTQKSIAWVKTNRSFTCGCGTEIKLDSSQFRATVEKVEAEIRKLEQTIRNMGR